MLLPKFLSPDPTSPGPEPSKALPVWGLSPCVAPEVGAFRRTMQISVKNYILERLFFAELKALAEYHADLLQHAN